MNSAAFPRIHFHDVLDLRTPTVNVNTIARLAIAILLVNLVGRMRRTIIICIYLSICIHSMFNNDKSNLDVLE